MKLMNTLSIKNIARLTPTMELRGPIPDTYAVTSCHLLIPSRVLEPKFTRAKSKGVITSQSSVLCAIEMWIISDRVSGTIMKKILSEWQRSGPIRLSQDEYDQNNGEKLAIPIM